MSRADRRRNEELGRRAVLKSALALAAIGATRVFGMPSIARAAVSAVTSAEDHSRITSAVKAATSSARPSSHFDRGSQARRH